MAMTLVSTVTVGSGGVTDVTFTNIPQTGADLLVLYSLRGSASATDTEFPFYFNGSGASYSFVRLIGNSTTQFSDSGTSAVGTRATGATATTNAFSSGKIYVTNYTGNRNKSYSQDVVTENNADTTIRSIIGAAWANTSAITQVSIQGSTIQQYSTVSLYIIS